MMANIGKRKDGRYYPKNNASSRISQADFDKLRNQDAKRSPMARTIDKGIRAPLDMTGERWAKKPNRCDFPGIDDPKPLKTKKGVNVGAFTIYPEDDFELVT